MSSFVEKMRLRFQRYNSLVREVKGLFHYSFIAFSIIFAFKPVRLYQETTAFIFPLLTPIKTDTIFLSLRNQAVVDKKLTHYMFKSRATFN